MHSKMVPTNETFVLSTIRVSDPDNYKSWHKKIRMQLFWTVKPDCTSCKSPF